MTLNKALDELGLAITNAGYEWTSEMRSAYEKGIRESRWVGLTDEEQQELHDKWQKRMDGWGSFYQAIEAKLKEKNT